MALEGPLEPRAVSCSAGPVGASRVAPSLSASNNYKFIRNSLNDFQGFVPLLDLVSKVSASVSQQPRWVVGSKPKLGVQKKMRSRCKDRGVSAQHKERGLHRRQPVESSVFENNRQIKSSSFEAFPFEGQCYWCVHTCGVGHSLERLTTRGPFST